jgi:hypothetical protein
MNRRQIKRLHVLSATCLMMILALSTLCYGHLSSRYLGRWDIWMSAGNIQLTVFPMTGRLHDLKIPNSNRFEFYASRFPSFRLERVYKQTGGLTTITIPLHLILIGGLIALGLAAEYQRRKHGRKQNTIERSLVRCGTCDYTYPDTSHVCPECGRQR